MPVDAGSIASQVGASGGLWTHTPVDWRGNKTNTPSPPAGWPPNAAAATPPDGSRVDTIAPSITAISVSGITTTGATINYTLDVAGTNQVEYGQTMSFGSVNTEGGGSGPQVKPLTGLTSARLYYYRIRASAGGLTTYSPQGTFTTL